MQFGEVLLSVCTVFYVCGFFCYEIWRSAFFIWRSFACVLCRALSVLNLSIAAWNIFGKSPPPPQLLNIYIPFGPRHSLVIYPKNFFTNRLLRLLGRLKFFRVFQITYITVGCRDFFFHFLAKILLLRFVEPWICTFFSKYLIIIHRYLISILNLRSINLHRDYSYYTNLSLLLWMFIQGYFTLGFASQIHFVLNLQIHSSTDRKI